MKNSITHTQFIPALIVTGFASMMSQIILLRELMIIFLGNELTLGIILGLWLLGTAIGSGIGGRIVKILKDPIQFFIIIQFVLTSILPLTVILIRVSPTLWNLQLGELISLLPIILLPLTALLPICILTGFLYTLGCKIYNIITKETSTAISKVYLFEAIGAGLASFVTTIILFRFLETFQLAFVICTANIIAVVSLLYFYKKKSLLQKIITLSLLPILIIFMLFLFPIIDKISNKKFWRTYELLHSETTIYGNIAVTKFGDNISFFENGVLMFTHPDLFYAEESVHFALLEHPNPQNVLLIGGGTGGSLRQILFHPQVKYIDYVELDPKIIKLGKQYLPTEETAVLKEPRVHIRNEDGRLFIKQTDRKYNVVVVNLPDPQTALINRFYTLEFFQQTRKILTNDGVISFNVTSSENVIGRDLANFLSCLYNTMSQAFAEVVLIPGDTNHFIGCIRKNVLTKDPYVLTQRLLQRKLNTIYLHEYYIPFRMSPDRMDYLYKRVVNNSNDKINHDFRPAGNFYNLVVWTTYFNQYVKNIFLFLNRVGFNGILILSGLLVLPFLIRLINKKGREKNFRYGIIKSIAVVGFTEISVEVIIILGFQAIYGYAYFQLALILSSFMIGLAFGSFIAIIKLRQTRAVFLQFKIFQFLMAVYPLVLLIVLYNSSQFAGSTLFRQFVFSLLTITAGFIAGYQYPLASHLYCKLNTEVEKTGAVIYASDLTGACVGALITSAVLIPILGILQTCCALSLMNIAIFIGLLLAKEMK